MSKKNSSPKIFYSSDWHFGHNRIIEFERQQFQTIQEHDEFLIDTITDWGSQWPQGSTLWFLGDFGDTDYLWVFDILVSHGHYVNMILGNHDKVADIPKFQEHVDILFEYPVFLSNKLILSHHPQACWEGQLNIHGHLHGSKLDSLNYINASIHVADYKPISERYIANRFAQLPKHVTRFLYEPYADMYKFTQPKEDAVMDKNGRIDLSASRLLQRINKEHRDKNNPYQPYTGGLNE